MDRTRSTRGFWLWGAESVGEGLIATVSSTYIAIYMTDIALIPLGIVTAAMLIMSISDFVMAASAGAIISMTKPGRWGRLRTYLILCPPIAALFYVLHFISIPGTPWLSAVIITGSFIAAKLVYNLVYVANVSLIPVISKDQATKNKFSSQRMVCSNAGRMIANSATPAIIALLVGRFSEQLLYPSIMLGAGIIYIITNYIHFWISKGFESQSDNSQQSKKDTLSLKTVLKTLATNPQLLITLIIDLASNVASIVLPSLAVYYYKYVLQRPELTSLHMLLTGIAAICGALSVRALGSKIKDTRKALLIIYPIVGAGIFMTRFCSGNVAAFMALNFIVHGLTGTTQPFELSLYMNNVTHIKRKTGNDVNALVMGLSGVTVKLANVLKSVMIPFTLSLSGYVADNATAAVEKSIINAYSILPAIIPMVGLIFLKFFYKLSDENMRESGGRGKSGGKPQYHQM